MRYFAATDGNLCAVVYGTRAGYVVEIECPSMDVAEAEAARLNRAQRHREAAARHVQALRAAVAVLGGPRAGLRYFEPDVYA